MDPQAVLGLAVALQIRSAIAQQNVIMLRNMLMRRPRKKHAKKKLTFVSFQRAFICV